MAGMDGVAGLTVRTTVLFTPEYEAVSVTGVEVLMFPVVSTKLADVDPCGIVTLGGTLAAPVFELDSDTAMLAPAAAVRVTVHVADWPPVTALGLTEMLLSAGGTGLTVSPSDELAPE
jgi:hypothetical protein